MICEWESENILKFYHFSAIVPWIRYSMTRIFTPPLSQCFLRSAPSWFRWFLRRLSAKKKKLIALHYRIILLLAPGMHGAAFFCIFGVGQGILETFLGRGGLGQPFFVGPRRVVHPWLKLYYLTILAAQRDVQLCNHGHLYFNSQNTENREKAYLLYLSIRLVFWCFGLGNSLYWNSTWRSPPHQVVWT